MKGHKEDKPSRYEKEIELNEKCYKFHFDNIEYFKNMIIFIQKQHDETNDPKLKDKYLRNLKEAQKQLAELENKTEEVTNYYNHQKKYLDSLR